MGNTQGNNTAPSNSTTPNGGQNQVQNAGPRQSGSTYQLVHEQRLIDYSEKDLEFIESKEMDEAYGEIRIYRIKNSGQPHPDDPNHLMEDIEICTKTKIFDSKEECSEYFNDLEEKKSLIHPNLVSLYKTNIISNSNLCSNIHKIDIAFEYIKHSLQTEILNRFQSKDYFEENSIFDLIEQVLNSLYYLGSAGIIHGDIQPRTILIDNYGNFKITDIRFLTSGMCGYRKHLAGIETECFLAPELLSKLRRQTLLDDNEIDQEKADVFSLGLVALAMATLQNVDAIYDFDEYLVKEEEIQHLLEVTRQNYSQSLYLLLASMLNYVDKRLDVESGLDLIDQIRSDQFNQEEFEKNRFQTEIQNQDNLPTITIDQQNIQNNNNNNNPQNPLTGSNKFEDTQKFVKPADYEQEEQRLQEQQLLQQRLRQQMDEQEQQRLIQQQYQSQSPQRTNTIKQSIGNSDLGNSQSLAGSSHKQRQKENQSDIEARIREAILRSEQTQAKYENSQLRLIRDQLLADELYIPLDPNSSKVHKSLRNGDSTLVKRNGIYQPNIQGISSSTGTAANSQVKYLAYPLAQSHNFASVKNSQVSSSQKQVTQGSQQFLNPKWRI